MGAQDRKILATMVKRMKNQGADPLSPIIDAYLIEREKPKAKRVRKYDIDMKPRARPGGRISPSSIGGCQREAVFRFTGTRGSRKIDPDQQLIFEDGNWRHHKWQAIFYDMEAVLGADRFEVVAIEEVASWRRKYVSGSFDAIVRINGILYVIDFKGINDNGFGRVYRDGAPLKKHRMQLLLYMKAKKIQHGIIMYENKNNNLRKCFGVTFEDEEWQNTVQWVNEVIKYLQARRLPAKHHDCAKGNFQYEKCGFAGLCYGKLDRVELRDLAYSSFDSIEEAWERGHAELQASVRPQADDGDQRHRRRPR